MPSLVLCYAPEDQAAAHRLGDSLEANLDYAVQYDECVVRPGFDLVDAADRALSAEAALLLLSPDSVPKTWRRERWEPVFFHKPAEFGALLGFVLLRHCQFPELLRRHRFFDASADPAVEARAIRRWLLRPDRAPRRDPALNPALLPLRDAVAERPGFADGTPHAQAISFAAACEEDFEAVHRLDCHGRTRAGILGDISYRLRLSLAGTVAENRDALVTHCRSRRYLFVLANTRPEDREFLAFGGRASVLLTNDAPVPEPAGPGAVFGAFLAVPRDEELCATLLGDAASQAIALLDADFEAGLRLGWAVIAAMKEARRFAEAVELLDSMERAARGREDALALYRVGWEQSWLRETSPGEEVVRILPTAGPDVVQLDLF